MFIMADSRIHVVHIIPSLFFGGAERFVVNLINGSNPEQFRYTIITFVETNPLHKELTFPDCQVVVVNKQGVSRLRWLRRLKKTLYELRPDILHTHLFGGDIWGRLAARSVGVPIITTEHSFNLREGSMQRLARWLLKNSSDCYTAPSQVLQQYLQHTLKIKKPIILIRHGIELKLFHFSPPTFETPTLRLIVIGRLVPEKGQAIVLQALALIKNLPWSLEILGEGQEQKNLEQVAIDLGLPSRVKFSGSSLNIPSKLKQADLVVVPSLEAEGLGMVVLEGMAAGRVVIGSRVGGITELIKDRETGILVEAGDVRVWSKTLAWCFTHQSELKKLAIQAQEYAQQHFSRKKMVQEYEKIYLQLAKKIGYYA